MSFQVLPKSFADALARVMAAVDRSKDYPVLGHVLLTSGNGQLTLRTTDLNVEITTAIDCEGELPPIVAPADRLQNTFAAIVDRASATFAIEDNGFRLIITSGRSRFTIPTLPNDQFPSLSSSEVGCTFTMDGRNFAEILSSCGFAIADRDIGRPYLEGLHLFAGRIDDKDEGNMLCGVATNGHIFSAREVPADMPHDVPPIILPRRSVQMLEKLVASWSELHLELSTDRLIASFGPTRYVTKLIEATYPDWRRTIPRNEPALSYDSDVLIAAIRTAVAAVQADKKVGALKMTISEAETLFTIDNSDGTAGGADACAHSLLAEEWPEVTLGLNPKYLIEVVTALKAETIQVALTDAATPVVLRCPSLPDRMTLVMPRRA